MAGYRVLWASEFVEAARETYALNHPGVILDARDIREVQPEDVLRAVGMRPGEVDVLEGSPPCASFSTAGRRQEGWGEVRKYSDVRQRVDDLFFEYVRLLRGIRPKAFVAENVSGLVKGVAKGYFKTILAALKESGYRVSARVLDAKWLGVPQSRQRLIFVGVREDLGKEPAHPKPLGYQYTVADACPWISRLVHDTSGTFGQGDVTNKPCPAITVGIGGLNSVHYKVNSIEGTAVGREAESLVPGEQSGKYFNLIRAHADKPSPTICASHGQHGIASVIHPTEQRKFTIAELKRICSFPDDFALTGTYAQQWERLGRAVPPLMMRAVAETVRDDVLNGGSLGESKVVGKRAGPKVARRARR